MCGDQAGDGPITAFDDVAREGDGPADHVVGRFDYLNASGRPEAAAVRVLIDGWLADYPAAHRAGMIRRLRSRDDVLHGSSMFELALHALLLRRGFAILEVEPVLPNGRAPDFLVQAPDGTRFYVEATLATGVAATDAGADRRMRDALQAIDDVASPDFFLHLHTRGTLARPVAVGKLRRAVQRFVDGLDYQAAIAGGAQAVIPVFRHEEHGARFTLRPVPKRVRRPGGRAVGGRMLPAGIVRPEAAIRSAVQGKAGRYGDVDLPLVIAVNALEDYAGVDDAVEALFGTTGVAVRDGGELLPVRNADGAWRGPGGPVYTRVSAVLFVERLSAWSIGQRTPRLILNPWARSPIGDIPLGAEVIEVADGRLVTRAGRSLGEIFGLPEGWPE